MIKTTLTRGLALLGLGLLLAACGGPAGEADTQTTAAPAQTYNWKMVTSWPKNFPGTGTAAEHFARLVEDMSSGRMRIRVYGAGELVPALEVFDAVSAGTAEIGHTAAYYWKGKAPEAQFFTALPFGLNGREMNAWIQYGGGRELWRELYAPFNLIPLPGGNAGVQMGGWFNKEINSAQDFRGLQMRVPGLAGEVLVRLGAVPANLPADQVYTSLQTGVIDAAEWTTPYNDLAFGFQDIARYYYYPGWHEPGSIMEFMFNKELFEALPADLQAILETAALATNLDMTDEFTARNSVALRQLVEEHGVDVRPFPPDLLLELERHSKAVIDELGAVSPLAARILASYREFESLVRDYHLISEEAYDRARRAAEAPQGPAL